MPRTGYRNSRRHFVDGWTLSSELKISVRRLQQLVKEGVLERSGRDRYLFEINVTKYECYLKRFEQEKGYLPWSGFRDETTGAFVRVR